MTSESGSKAPTEAEALVDEIVNSQHELFHDERGHPMIARKTDQGRRVIPLDSKEFGSFLSQLSHTHFKKPVRSEVRSTVTSALSGIAMFERPRIELSVRSAKHKGSFWLDLDGYKAIEVNNDGWKIHTEPPILFRHFRHQKDLPIPERDGDIKKVLDYMNVKSEDHKLLLLTYLVAALVPDIPSNLLVISGQQGTAKSTLLKVLKSLIDPSDLDLNISFSNREQMVLTAWQSRMLNLDNISHVSRWLSDALCCTVTGAAQATRSLYTNEELNVLSVRRLVGITGINLVSDRPDVLERTTIIDLPPIDPGKRREEIEFWESFRKDRGFIFGGMLNVLQKAMTLKGDSDVRLKSPPRMIDFANWCAAAGVAMGYELEEIQAAFDRNTAHQYHHALQSNLVATAVVALLDEMKEDTWTGPSTTLFNMLNDVAKKYNYQTRAQEWPKSAEWLTRRINEVAPVLESFGIKATPKRSSKCSIITLEKLKPEETPNDEE